MNKKGTVFNIQRFCTNDGPGIRTTVFLKGCPLDCLWCHNPEGQSPDKQIMFYQDKCTRCGKCADLSVDDADFFCVNDAKTICGKELLAEEVMAEVLKDRVYYKNSGGGLTLSGGEPLGQFEFALELLRLAKTEGLHTCVETCGYVPKEKLLQIAEYVDLFLFDWKITDSELHKKYIGADNRLIRENLEALDEIGAKVVLRCPIIPDVNDTPEHFCGIAELANTLECVTEVQIEPYHAFGTHKYSALSGENSSAEFTVPDEAAVQSWIDEISAQTSKLVVLA